MISSNRSEEAPLLFPLKPKEIFVLLNNGAESRAAVERVSCPLVLVGVASTVTGPPVVGEDETAPAKSAVIEADGGAASTFRVAAPVKKEEKGPE